MAEKILQFKASNEVEKLQINAANSIEKREEFWSMLLNSRVYVMGELDEKTGNAIFHTWQGTGEDACGVFTSLEKLIGAMPPNTPYIKINARDVFEIMINEGIGAFINPRYKPQVRLKSKELKAMLQGNFNEICGSKA